MRRVIPEDLLKGKGFDSHRIMWAVQHQRYWQSAVRRHRASFAILISEFQRVHLFFFFKNYARSGSFSRAIMWLQIIALLR